MSNVSVILPAFNESKKIKNTLRALKNIQEIKKIIVIDDGSKDNTFEEACLHAHVVIKKNRNQGKGSALNDAIKFIDTEIIILVDADLEDTANEVEKLLQPIINGEADIAVAAFSNERKRKKGLGLVKNFSRWIIKIYCGKLLKEPLSGQRVLTKEALQYIYPFANGFAVEVITSIKALRNGCRIKEIDTNMRHRIDGLTLKGFYHRGKQFFHIIISLINYRRNNI